MRPIFLSLFSKTLLLLMACFAFQGTLVAEVTDPETNFSFPEQIVLQQEPKDATLLLTGVTTRKKTGIKIYSIASYADQAISFRGRDPFDVLMQTKLPKQLNLKWVRTVDSARLKEGFMETFENVFTYDEFLEYAPLFESFLKVFDQGVKKGDEHVFRILEGKKVLAYFNGELISTVTSKTFARKLYADWLGDKAIVDRDELISLIPNSF